MPFSYYARLSRARQAIYRKSDSITEVRLARPRDLTPLVQALEGALETEERVATQSATERLVAGLLFELDLPPVRVEVLAARPHARWGELHGLYTAEPGQRPRIQLWMRTARQKRVVAFRTYLRTLLHEVGHHIDYTLLGLRDSLHTEGFYKRESSLFHQLVPERTDTMPTMEEYAKSPRPERLARLARTADDLAAAIKGQSDAALARRPDPRNWAATEVICHLRDTEENFMNRFQAMLAFDDPKFVGVDPDRWAEERQYLANDAAHAVRAFRRRRSETLDFLGKLEPAQWTRGGVYATRGRLTIEDITALIAWHDDNHLDQIRRALEGRV